MPYKPSHVANSFLVGASKEGVADVDALKIQKLVYFFHGWFLATRGEPGIGELFEAWPFGPVLSSLYHEFKSNGRRPIQGYARDLDPKSGEYISLMADPEDSNFSLVFNRVWNRYKSLSGLQLSMMTHAEGTPWREARKRGDQYLSNDEIKSYFRKLALRE